MSRHSQTAASALALALTLAAPLMAGAADAMRVVRDPATGELRGPTAAEAAAFEKAEAQLRAARGSKQVNTNGKLVNVEIHHPDGTVETPLGDDSMMYSVVAANADGSLTMDCLPAREAKKFVAAGGRKPSASLSSSNKSTAKAGHAHQ